MREEDDKQLQEIEACTETVKLDANKIKEHLAAENATTRVDRTKRSTKVEHKIRAEGVGGEQETERERGSTKTVRSQEEPEVERCHREMAGKTGRTVRSRARPHANRADASVPSGKESQVHAGQT